MKKLFRCMTIISVCLGLLIASSPVGAETAVIEPKAAVRNVKKVLNISYSCQITVSGSYETNGRAAYNINLNARVTGGSCTVLHETYRSTSNGMVNCSIYYDDGVPMFYPDFKI